MLIFVYNGGGSGDTERHTDYYAFFHIKNLR